MSDELSGPILTGEHMLVYARKYVELQRQIYALIAGKPGYHTVSVKDIYRVLGEVEESE